MKVLNVISQHYYQHRNDLRVAVITVLVVIISLLHYLTGWHEAFHHIFYRELYFFPLVLAGFWFDSGGLQIV